MRELDYTCYPDALAPRRFEVINPTGKAYAHGVMFHNGQVVIAHPGDDGAQVYGRMSPDELATRHAIRWIDPPFGHIKSEDEE